MRYKINSVVILVLGLAAFGAPTAVPRRSQAGVVKFGAPTDGGGTVYLPGLASKHLPIPVPQDIGPVCPPGTSCVNQ